MFGPSWWALLTCIGHASDELQRRGKLTRAQAELVAHAVQLVTRVIPCIHCRRSFKVFLERLKAEERAALEGVVGAGRALHAVWRLHAMVNDKLHRQRVDAALARVGGVPRDVAERLERAGLYAARGPTLEVLRKRIAVGTAGRIGECQVFTVLFSLALDHPRSRDEEAEDPEAPRVPGDPSRTAHLIDFLHTAERCLGEVVAPAMGGGPRLERLRRSMHAVRGVLLRDPAHTPRDAVLSAVAAQYAAVMRLEPGETPKSVAARYSRALEVSRCSHGTCE